MVKVSVFGIIGICMAVVSIILVLIAMLSNGWYNVRYSESYAGVSWEVEMDLGLTEAETTITSYGQSESESNDLEDEAEDVGSLTQIFLIISLVIILAFVVVGLIASLRIIPGLIASIVGFVAAACLIFVVIYYPIAFPDACEEAGASDKFVDGLSLNWAYFLTLGVIVFLLIASVLLLGVRRPLKYSLALPSRRYEHYTNDRDRRESSAHQRDDHRDRRREEDYYDDRGRRESSAHRRDDHRDRRRDDYYDDRGRRGSSAHPRDDRRDRRRRRDDHYDDRGRHSSSSGGIPHTLTVFKCPECGAAIMENDCPYCGWRT